MSTPLVDRFHFAARGLTKTPIVAEAPDPKTTDGVALLRLYDPIDWDGGPWGVSAREFAAVLDGLGDDVKTIELHISSPGGHVWDALAIMNALRQHPARVVAVVDGIAASAASFIMLAGDEVVAAQGAEVMVHSPMGVAIGNADDMAKMAADLEHEARNMAGLYAAKAGGTVEEWLAVMATETWYSAEEAVAAGLVDRILDKPADTTAKARFDLSVFAYAGRAKAPAPKLSPAAAVEPAAAGGTTPEEARVSDTLLTGLRQSLGLAEDADEATVMAEHAKAMAALQELNDKAAAPPPTPSVPEGHVVVPEARLRDLEAGAANGTAAAAKLRDREREEFLDSVRAKYAPANRSAWAKEYDRDPVGTRAHFQTAPEIVALTPIGHDGDVPDDNPAAIRESADYKNWSLK